MVLWQINPVRLSDVTLDNNAFAYDGTKKAPLITEVRAGGLVLKRNEWKVEGTVSETAVGKYSMLVSSKNLNIIGYQSVSWSIVEPCSYELSLPLNLTKIGEAAFAGNRSIPSAYVPDTVSAIGARAFDGCTALTTVTAPAGGTAESRLAAGKTPRCGPVLLTVCCMKQKTRLLWPGLTPAGPVFLPGCRCRGDLYPRRCGPRCPAPPDAESGSWSGCRPAPRIPDTRAPCPQTHCRGAWR